MPKRNFRSKNEREAYAVLRSMFPNTEISHDFPLGGGLKLDFLIRSTLPIGVEVDGEQHFGFCSRFHTDITDFHGQQARDAEKDEICERMGIVLIHHDARGGISEGELRRSIVKAVENASEGTSFKKVCRKNVENEDWKKAQKSRNAEFNKRIYSERKDKAKRIRLEKRGRNGKDV